MAGVRRTYSPAVEWDPEVANYLSQSLGPDRLRKSALALCRPPLRPTLRVNTLRGTAHDVCRRLQEELKLAAPPTVHPHLPYAVQLQGTGPHAVPYDELCGDLEIVINRRAGEAVLKGSNIYAPGVLAASRGLAPGQRVAVSVARELPGRHWCGINRGEVVGAGRKQQGTLEAPVLQDRSSLYLGTAVCEVGRRKMFRDNYGLVAKMDRPVWDIPSCHGVLRGEVMLQAEPSIVAAAALNPAPGSRVLDMCAAPGGKATMLAQLMGGDTGQVVALDRTHAKVLRIRELATDLGLSNVKAYKADATRILAAPSPSSPSIIGSFLEDVEDVDEMDTLTEAVVGQVPETGHAEQEVTFPAESFDAVLLDAPCSALGIRPRLAHASWTLPRLRALAAYQRALLYNAVQLLKPGGALVYCTCTINPAENEGNVRWVLDRFKGVLTLDAAEPLLGGPGLIGQDPDTGEGWLSIDESGKVQRWEPSADTDTIGFFIARFTKRASSV